MRQEYFKQMFSRLLITDIMIEYRRRFVDLIFFVIVPWRSSQTKTLYLRAAITVINPWTSCCVSPDIISATPSNDRRVAKCYMLLYNIHLWNRRCETPWNPTRNMIERIFAWEFILAVFVGINDETETLILFWILNIFWSIINSYFYEVWMLFTNVFLLNVIFPYCYSSLNDSPENFLTYR